jgi:tRNA dimethylallyltransferase
VSEDSTFRTEEPLTIFLMGPTASGKTDLAVRLVQELPCEIVSVDSAMVYRGMDIGTAKPEAEILEIAPHRLIDIVDPAEAYSAAQFREDALREMEDIRASGKIPLLTGGTMLYFRSLTDGLSTLPSADPVIRRELEQQAEQKGWADLHSRLAKVDPESAQRIHPNDPQRIQRALEVYEITGKTISEHYREQGHSSFPWNTLRLIVAPPDRAELHERIARRFHLMMEKGLIEEVEKLWARGDLTEEMPSMRAVGYRQVLKYLLGDYSYEEMIEKGIIATRQLAKRQFTWLRTESDAHWLDSTDPGLWDKTLKLLMEYKVSLDLPGN